MVETTVHGSGGFIIADLTDEQAKKADLGVGKLFLAPIGKIEETKMIKYFCKECEVKYDQSPAIRPKNTDEEVADNLILIERGQYTCKKCDSIIGEYRVFQKQDESSEVGPAKSSS